MKILVIGAVAARTSAAAKARRNNDQAEIVIYERDQHISYSGCGLPYYIGGEVEGIDTDRKQVAVKNLASGEVFADCYDKLILATGASAFRPNITGIDLVHVLFSAKCIGNAAQNILLGDGFKKVYNLSGGQQFYKGSRGNN